MCVITFSHEYLYIIFNSNAFSKIYPFLLLPHQWKPTILHLLIVIFILILQLITFMSLKYPFRWKIQQVVCERQSFFIIKSLLKTNWRRWCGALLREKPNSQVWSCIKMDCQMTKEIKGSIHLFMINLAFSRAVWALGSVWKTGYTDQSFAATVLMLCSSFGTFGLSVLWNETKKNKVLFYIFPVVIIFYHSYMITSMTIKKLSLNSKWLEILMVLADLVSPKLLQA